MNFDFISSLKEFFFDIIGFLVPGVIVLMLAGEVFNFPIKLDFDLLETTILAYAIGYVVFSFSLIKENLYNKISSCVKINSSKNVIAKLEKDDTFLIASAKIKETMIEEESQKLRYKSYRNIALSEVPESNQKVYTFMFRAELFDQLHTISLLSFIIGITILLLSTCCDLFYEIDFNYYWLFFFIILIFTLRKGWKRFYEISMRIPFSLYLSKNKNS